MQALRHLAGGTGPTNHLKAFLLSHIFKNNKKKRYSRVNRLSGTHYSCFKLKIIKFQAIFIGVAHTSDASGL